MTDFRLKLNNKLAGRGETAEYECSSTGPQNAVTWTATVKISGDQYGKGSGKTQSEAKEAAAAQALEALRQLGR